MLPNQPSENGLLESTMPSNVTTQRSSPTISRPHASAPASRNLFRPSSFPLPIHLSQLTQPYLPQAISRQTPGTDLARASTFPPPLQPPQLPRPASTVESPSRPDEAHTSGRRDLTLRHEVATATPPNGTNRQPLAKFPLKKMSPLVNFFLQLILLGLACIGVWYAAQSLAVSKKSSSG